MSQLSQFQFDKIGSLQFDSDSLTIQPVSVNAMLWTKQLISRLCTSASDPGLTFRKIGPFDTSREYFEALLVCRQPPQDQFAIGMRQLLKMMLQSIPRSVSTKTPRDSETFVLAHPDFDSQNVLVSEDGTLTALIDWDNVHTVPRCIGYTRYPTWITRDWDPAHVTVTVCQTLAPRTLPEELEYYRSRYAHKMRTLVPKSSRFFNKVTFIRGTMDCSVKSICHIAYCGKDFSALFSGGH